MIATRWSLLTVLTVLAVSAGVAEAHIYLTAPAPRYLYEPGLLTLRPMHESHAPRCRACPRRTCRWGALQRPVERNDFPPRTLQDRPGHHRRRAPRPPHGHAAKSGGGARAGRRPFRTYGGARHARGRTSSITPTAAGPACTLQVAQTVDGSGTVYYSVR